MSCSVRPVLRQSLSCWLCLWDRSWNEIVPDRGTPRYVRCRLPLAIGDEIHLWNIGCILAASPSLAPRALVELRRVSCEPRVASRIDVGLTIVVASFYP